MLGDERRLRDNSSPRAARLEFATALVPPEDFEEAASEGRNGEAATVARRLFGQFMMSESKAFKRPNLAAIKRLLYVALF